MKRDVNFSLLGLLVLLLGSMVVLAFYFTFTYHQLQARYGEAEDNLENLSQKLEERIAEVDETKEELELREKTLIDIMNKLNLTQKKVSSLGDFYTKERGSREEIEEELEDTEKERDFWKLNYTQTKQDLQLWKKNYQVKEQEVKTAQTRISALGTIITEVEREIEQDDGAEKNLGDIEKKINGLKGSIGDLEGDIEEIEDNALRSELEEAVGDLFEWLEKVEDELEELKENIKEMKDSLNRA